MYTSSKVVNDETKLKISLKLLMVFCLNYYCQHSVSFN